MEQKPCAGEPLVGPFTVSVVETTFVESEQPAALPEPEAPARSVMLRSEFFEFVAPGGTLPESIVSLRHYARGETSILEWDTVFEGGQLVMAEHQVLFGSKPTQGEHLKTIWRERALGQGAAHTVIAETVESGPDAGAWHVLRYGMRSEAHGTSSLLEGAQGAVKTRLGFLQEARTGALTDGALTLWNGELGCLESGLVSTVDWKTSVSLAELLPGLQAPRWVVWRSTESSNHLAFQFNGSHCTGLQLRQRGPWAQPLHPDMWQRLDRKWRREAPVLDPGPRARAIQATAPFFDKTIHKVPTWHRM